jgi:hypothetical protein
MATPSKLHSSFLNQHKEIDRLRNHGILWSIGAALITTVALTVIAVCIVYAVRTHSKVYLVAYGAAIGALSLSIPLWVKSFYLQKKITKKRTELIESMEKGVKNKLIEAIEKDLKTKKDNKKKSLVTYIEEEILRDAGLRSSKTLLLGELIKKFPKENKEFSTIHKALEQAKTNLGKELEDLAEE